MERLQNQQNLPLLMNLQQQRERVQQQILLQEALRERQRQREQKGQIRLPRSMEDIELRPAERGLLLGMTEMGKSTLGDALLARARYKYPDQHIIIFDSKPNNRPAMELNVIPSLLRNRNWDYKKEV